MTGQRPGPEGHFWRGMAFGLAFWIVLAVIVVVWVL
jgi:hypothetical protein